MININKKDLIVVSIWLASLAVCFLLVDRVSAYILRNVILDSEFRFSRVYNGGIDAQVLILGNSRGVNSFYAPEISEKYNISVFNLSYNGMSSELSEMIFLDYLDHNVPPKLVIIEITNVTSDNNLLPELKQYSQFSHRLKSLIQTDYPFIAKVSKLSQLFTFNGEIFFRSLWYLHRSDQNWINKYQISKDAIEQEAIATKSIELIPIQRQFDALERTLYELQKRNIDVLLFIGPYLPIYAKRITNLKDFKQETESRLGISIHDYSMVIQDLNAFADRQHINLYGAQQLLEIISNDGLFDKLQ